MSSAGSGGGSSFIPRQELLTVLMSMGLSRNASTRGLYYTGNNNADMAAAWIFENQDKDLEAELIIDDSSSDSDGEMLEPGMEGFLDEGAFFKMVLVVNTSLHMGVGKMAAQVAHGTLGLYRHLVEEQQRHGEMLLQWEQFGETKVVLKGLDAAHLIALAAKATALDIPHYLVQDVGKTQVPSGSTTVLAIMGQAAKVNEVTGEMSLL